MGRLCHGMHGMRISWTTQTMGSAGDGLPWPCGEGHARDITEDPGVVDEDIDASPRLDRSLDDLIAVLDRIVVRDGLAAGLPDLVDDHICRRS